MPEPTLTGFAADLYERLSPWAHADADNGYALALLCQAVGAQFDEIDAVARAGTDDEPGWAALMDPDAAPAFTLDWLAQFAGVSLNRTLDEAQKRVAIRATEGVVKRGTPAAMQRAARPFLTGAQSVFLAERDGDAYQLTVITRTDETPDPDAVEAALLSQKPAGIVMTYSVVPGLAYAELDADYTDYGDVASSFTDYSDVRGY